MLGSPLFVIAFLWLWFICYLAAAEYVVNRRANVELLAQYDLVYNLNDFDRIMEVVSGLKIK